MSNDMSPRELHISNLLSNVPIHGIFHRCNFDDTIQYDKIKPVLRLASQFVRMKHMHPYWYMLLNGKDVEKKTSKGDTYFEIQKPSPGKDIDIDTTLLLAAFARRVTFSAKRLEKLGVMASTRCPGRLADGFRCRSRQCHARIEINDIFLEEVYATIEAPVQGGTGDPVTLFPLLRLAMTLIHELGHAALRGSRSILCCSVDDYAMQGCNTFEEGFEMEVALFGKHIAIERAHWFDGFEAVHQDQWMMVACDWPEPWIERAYAEKDDMVCFTVDSKKVSKAVYIFEDDVASYVFEESFWNEKDPRFGLLPTAVGPFVAGNYKISLTEVQRADHRNCEALDEIRQQALYYLSKEGLLYRESKVKQGEESQNLSEGEHSHGTEGSNPRFCETPGTINMLKGALSLCLL